MLHTLGLRLRSVTLDLAQEQFQLMKTIQIVKQFQLESFQAFNPRQTNEPLVGAAVGIGNGMPTKKSID